MAVHIVKPGEHLAKIAHRYGFSNWKTLYEHPDNAGLKRLRPNPNQLHPGDIVHVPPLEAHRKTVETPAGARHVFRARVPKKKLKLKLVGPDGVALKDADYALTVEHRVLEGKTGGDGTLEAEIPCQAEEATLRIGAIEWQLRIGGLNPLTNVDDDGVSGAQMRLANLGFYHGQIDGFMGPLTRKALRVFQKTWRLDTTGEFDDATRARLVDKHGG